MNTDLIDGPYERTISGETWNGIPVAAYRETHPEHGDKFGYSYSGHWSTPNWKHPNVKVERLFTEEALTQADARIARLEDLLAEYGDRVRMARAEPASKQHAIDEAIGNATARAALKGDI
jgi:hypothetical protein